VNAASKVIDRLEEQHVDLKNEVDNINDKSISHINESKNQEREYEQLKKTFEKKVAQLREREKEINSLRAVLDSRRNELSSFGKEINRLEGPSRVTASRGVVQGGFGWAPAAVEKTHAIKVLEHESKVYNFEKNLNLKPGPSYR
jgi:chromosome segregation ATPase